MVEKQEERTIYATPNDPSPTRPVIFNEDICNGCNICVDVCLQDVFIPNPEEGKPPILLYPDECWYDGNCVLACSRKGAIKFNIPIMWRTAWREIKKPASCTGWIKRVLTDTA